MTQDLHERGIPTAAGTASWPKRRFGFTQAAGASSWAFSGVLAVFTAVPLIVLLGALLGLPTDLDARALSTLWAPRSRSALGNTLVCSFLATLFGVSWGGFFAMTCARTDAWGKRALAAVVILPLAVPPYLLAMGARALFDERTGFVSTLVGASPIVIESRTGIGLVLGLAFSPIVFLRVRAALSALDPSLEEAARCAGASPMQALRIAVLPFSLPALLSSAALVFVASTAAFGVPALLGLGADPPVLVSTTRIWIALQAGTPAGLQDALALTVGISVVSVVAFALPGLLPRRDRTAVTGRTGVQRMMTLGIVRVPLGAASLLLAALVIGGPLAALTLQALTMRLGAPVSRANIGLAHVTAVLGDQQVQSAACTSLVLATSAALACVVSGAILVLHGHRTRTWHQRAARGLAEASWALPGTVMALGLILTFSREVRMVLFERVTLTVALGTSGVLLFVAYAVKNLALAMRSTTEGAAQIHGSLVEAARTSGATATRAGLDITLPLLRPSLAAAFVAIALPLLSELTMSVLLQPPGTATLGVVLFQLNDYGDPQQAAALAVCLLLVVALGHFVIWFWQRRRPRAAEKKDV